VKPIRSYRRIILDEDLENAKNYMKGLVLDVGGGRKRGFFERPKELEWLILDINKKFSPNIIVDAQDLPIKSGEIDVLKCTELLEHVENPERVLKESHRVLKTNGILILSIPFNFGIHGDPHDFQRFTDHKLKKLLENNFRIITLKKQGLYFTVLSYMIKQNILNIKSRLRYLLYGFFPLLDFLVKLDNSTFVRKSKFMSSFTTGFFVIGVKNESN